MDQLLPAVGRLGRVHAIGERAARRPAQSASCRTARCGRPGCPGASAARPRRRTSVARAGPDGTGSTAAARAISRTTSSTTDDLQAMTRSGTWRRGYDCAGRRAGWENRGVTVPNVLATRYAGAELAAIWSPEHKIVLERRLWIAVLKAQRDLGVAVPDGVVEAYEDVVDKVDLDSIAARERVTRHDVKARIEEFSALAGHEHIHKGMTWRDLTENVEQLQVRQSLELLRDRTVAALARLGAARRRARVAGDGRPVPQRRRAGDHARQAVRDRGRRAAGRAAAGRGAARALPAARHQGADGHQPGHARPARRRRRQAGRARDGGSPSTSASTRC